MEEGFEQASIVPRAWANGPFSRQSPRQILRPIAPRPAEI
jgi:hypothetical protein